MHTSLLSKNSFVHLQVRQLVRDHPNLLRSANGLDVKLDMLLKLLNPAEGLAQLQLFIVQHPELLYLSPRTVEAKFTALCVISGLPAAAVVEAVLAQPHLLMDIQV